MKRVSLVGCFLVLVPIPVWWVQRSLWKGAATSCTCSPHHVIVWELNVKKLFRIGSTWCLLGIAVIPSGQFTNRWEYIPINNHSKDWWKEKKCRKPYTKWWCMLYIPCFSIFRTWKGCLSSVLKWGLSSNPWSKSGKHHTKGEKYPYPIILVGWYFYERGHDNPHCPSDFSKRFIVFKMTHMIHEAKMEH